MAEEEGAEPPVEEPIYDATQSKTYQNAMNVCCYVPPPPDKSAEVPYVDPCIQCFEEDDELNIDGRFKMEMDVVEVFKPRKPPHYPEFPEYYFCFIDDQMGMVPKDPCPPPSTKTPCFEQWESQGYSPER